MKYPNEIVSGTEKKKKKSKRIKKSFLMRKSSNSKRLKKSKNNKKLKLKNYKNGEKVMNSKNNMTKFQLTNHLNHLNIQEVSKAEIQKMILQHLINGSTIPYLNHTEKSLQILLLLLNTWHKSQKFKMDSLTKLIEMIKSMK